MTRSGMAEVKLSLTHAAICVLH